MILSFKAFFGLMLIAIAIGGGGVATYFNVRNSHGPKERAYVLRVSLISWTIIFSMLVVLYFLPSPYRYIALVGYLVVCPILVYRWSTMHQLIRLVEEREIAAEKEAIDPPV